MMINRVGLGAPVRPTGRPAALTLLAALALLGTLALMPGVLGHADVVSSQPAQGERLETAPTEIVIRFTEPVDLAVTELRLVNATKVAFALGDARLADDGFEVRAPIEDALPRGAYVLQWETISTADGHRTFGGIPFGVQTDADLSAGSAGAQDTRLDMILGKSLAFAGLSLVAGAFAFWYLVLPRGFRKGHEDRVERVGHVGAWMHLAGLLLFAFGDHANKGLSLSGFFFGNVFGQGLVLRIVLALLLVVGFHVSVRRAHVPAKLWAALATVAGLAFLVQGRFSHAAGFADLRTLGILVDAVHFAAIGMWVGGLIAFAVWLRGLPTERGALTDELRVVPKRFSDLATIAIVVVTLTGVYLMAAILGFRLDAYTASTYGRLLGAKIVLAVVIMGLGGMNKWLFVRRFRAGGGAASVRDFRQNVHREVALAVVVFLLIGAATNLSPPAEGEEIILDDGAYDPGILTEDRQTAHYNWTVNFHPPPSLEEPTHYFLIIQDRATSTLVDDAFDLTLVIENEDEPGLGQTEVALNVTESRIWETTGAYFSFPGTYDLTFRIVTGDTGPGGESVDFRFDLS